MKKLYKILAFAGLLSAFTSCDYLDIVPNETATEEDAFASEDAAVRYLYSCYGYMPAHQESHANYDYAGDEIVSCFPGEPIKLYFEGGYTSSNLGAVETIYKNMYKGIRQCYLLKANIGKVPGMSQEKKQDYINQVDFLIVYYHMNLMKQYGPVILVKELTDMGVSYENMAARSSYDECVDWVAGEFNRLAELLPAHREGSDYGLATSVAAKALRSRVLLYAASPLFNGNSEYYSDFVNNDGTALISQTSSTDKYVKAANAALEAIKFAEDNDYHLYEITGDDALKSEAPFPTDPIQRQLRLVYTDKQGTTEVLWANTRPEATYSVQNKSLPYRSFGGGYGPSLTMVERFYTENGLPIDEDPDFDYINRYGTSTMNDDIRGMGVTLNLHFKREPRFYSWVSFHNGFYECGAQGDYIAEGKEGCPWASKDMSNKKKQRWLTQYKKNDNCGKWSRTNNFSPTGYLNKKGVHPASQIRTGDGVPTKTYPIPIIRLGELYLNYAEACVGSGDASLISDGMVKLNVIRKRAGIDEVLTAWAKAKNHPMTNYSNTKQLMEIVQRERMIELYMEGHNFWDLRRWKMGEYLNKKQWGLAVDATTDATFLKTVELGYIRRFETPMNYLMPIPVSEVSANPQMVQNPKY